MCMLAEPTQPQNTAVKLCIRPWNVRHKMHSSDAHTYTFSFLKLPIISNWFYLFINDLNWNFTYSKSQLKVSKVLFLWTSGLNSGLKRQEVWLALATGTRDWRHCQQAHSSKNRNTEEQGPQAGGNSDNLDIHWGRTKREWRHRRRFLYN